MISDRTSRSTDSRYGSIEPFGDRSCVDLCNISEPSNEQGPRRRCEPFSSPLVARSSDAKIPARSGEWSWCPTPPAPTQLQYGWQYPNQPQSPFMHPTYPTSRYYLPYGYPNAVLAYHTEEGDRIISGRYEKQIQLASALFRSRSAI